MENINNEQEQLIEQDVNLIVEQSKGITISNEKDLQSATDFTKNIKQAMKKVNDFFEPIKKSAYATWKGITAKESEVLKPLEEAEKIVKGAMIVFINKQKEEALKREAELRKQQEAERQKQIEEARQKEAEGKTEEANEIIEKTIQQEEIDDTLVVGFEKPKADGMITKIDYEVIITDENKVPAYFNGICLREVNTSLIKKLAIQSKGKVQIEGITIKETSNISIRS